MEAEGRVQSEESGKVGSTAPGASFVCPSCGSQRSPDSMFCRYCGEHVAPVRRGGTPGRSSGGSEVTEGAGGGDVASISAMPQPPAVPQSQPVQQPVAQAAPSGLAGSQPVAMPVRPSPSVFQNLFSVSDLWSWLKKDEHRQIFYAPDKADMKEQDYIAQLQERLAENRIGAEIVPRNIRWDLGTSIGGSCRTTYAVQTHTHEVNPLACLIRFSHVGDFTFVEQKTFLVPPNLPPLPGNPIPVPPSGAGMIIVGSIIALLAVGAVSSRSLAVFGLFCLLIGVGLIVFGAVKGSKRSTAVRYNLQVTQAQMAWNKAWDDWSMAIEDIYGFQETTDGAVSRLYLAVFESMKQLNEKLFPGISAVDEHEQTSMSDITAQVSRRKASYH